MKQPKPWRRRAVPAKSPSDPTPTTTDNRRPTAKQDKKRPVSPSRQTPLTGPHPPRTARFARAAEHGRLHCSTARFIRRNETNEQEETEKTEKREIRSSRMMIASFDIRHFLRSLRYVLFKN